MGHKYADIHDDNEFFHAITLYANSIPHPENFFHPNTPMTLTEAQAILTRLKKSKIK